MLFAFFLVRFVLLRRVECLLDLDAVILPYQHNNRRNAAYAGQQLRYTHRAEIQAVRPQALDPRTAQTVFE